MVGVGCGYGYVFPERLSLSQHNFLDLRPLRVPEVPCFAQVPPGSFPE